MMKKENVIYFLFPLIFVFYFFFMKGRIGFWEGANFFLLNGEYAGEFISKPGGWSEWLGNLLTQFYKWPFAGAFILTLLPFGVYVFTRGIIRKLEIPSNWLFAAVLPFMGIWGLQCYMDVTLGEMLKPFFFYLFLWGYLTVSCQWIRYLVFSLLFPLAYLLLSTGGCVFLYVAYIMYECLNVKGNYRFGICVFWGLLLAVYPHLWQRWMCLMPSEKLYALSGIKDGDEFKSIFIFLYGYGVLLLGIAYIGRKMKKKGKRFFFLMQMLLIIAGCVWGVTRLYQRNTENLLQMDQAALNEEWDKVLEIAGDGTKLSREGLYYVSLALASRGELGEKLFDYPVWGIGCLYLPRTADYMTNIFGGEFYNRLKLPNEGIHWIFQASVASPMGMSIRTLKRLIDLNIQKGDSLLADRYLTTLEYSMLNDGWIKERRAILADPNREQVPSMEDNDFFIGGRPFLSDMARVLDGGRSMNMTLDYILCGLLLNKDLGKFVQIFTRFYPVKTGKRVPKVYEEALLVAITTGNAGIEKNYTISPERRKLFGDFNALMNTCGKNKESAKIVMKGFKNTWWYYFRFGEQKMMDMQGNLLEEYQRR